MPVDLDSSLKEVRAVMAQTLMQTPLRDVVASQPGMLGSGKMLRARIAFRLGTVTGVERDILIRSAAAVEMVHAASLLHDDVIDGGYLRRHAPAFWVEKGIPGAVLLGDLLLFRGLDLLTGLQGGRILQRMVELTGKVCEAEAEQELILRGQPPRWENCLSIARRKTGALFAFIAAVCGGDDDPLSESLQEAGYAAGAAYQLADDLLDANGTTRESGKTLGTDQARQKTTAAVAIPPDGMEATAFIHQLCSDSASRLAGWPAVQSAWRTYLDQDLLPAIRRSLPTAAG